LSLFFLPFFSDEVGSGLEEIKERPRESGWLVSHGSTSIISLLYSALQLYLNAEGREGERIDQRGD
jgi:hypothetical protein